jgi:hypothetical protein
VGEKDADPWRSWGDCRGQLRREAKRTPAQSACRFFAASGSRKKLCGSPKPWHEREWIRWIRRSFRHAIPPFLDTSPADTRQLSTPTHATRRVTRWYPASLATSNHDRRQSKAARLVADSASPASPEDPQAMTRAARLGVSNVWRPLARPWSWNCRQTAAVACREVDNYRRQLGIILIVRLGSPPDPQPPTHGGLDACSQSTREFLR